MTRYEAFAHQGFQEKGVTDVVVTRTDDAGWLQAGIFLVDLYCLGVKDAFVAEMPAIDWPEAMERIIPAQDRIALHPACARKLVEGAVAYTEALGFAPHRDYKKTRRVFGSVNSRDCPETFTYGKDGKPFFVAGPNDDEDRIDRVLVADNVFSDTDSGAVELADGTTYGDVAAPMGRLYDVRVLRNKFDRSVSARHRALCSVS